MTDGLYIKDLQIVLSSHPARPAIVNRLSLEIAPGEILGLVGESGSGKSMTALAIMGLLPPGIDIASGGIYFQGRELTAMSQEQLRRIRGLKLGMIFQEPMTALNPVFTIGRQVAEVFRAHLSVSKTEAWERAIDMLQKVGLPHARQRVMAYPHQLSGGMRQRVLIAMAMALNPPLLLADEPTTALDVTIQAQILNLLKEITGRQKAACLLITHNLAVVAQMAQRVAIMYAGRLVETAPVARLLQNPRHPYTKGLLACLPMRSQPGTVLPTISGQVPALEEIPANSCAFAPRCPQAMPRCRRQLPGLNRDREGSEAACFLCAQE
jgi:oligopeptide/dipeptide ABC transporter ATP-binding protein